MAPGREYRPMHHDTKSDFQLQINIHRLNKKTNNSIYFNRKKQPS